MTGWFDGVNELRAKAPLAIISNGQEKSVHWIEIEGSLSNTLCRRKQNCCDELKRVER